jgi:hypothetical protein
MAGHLPASSSVPWFRDAGTYAAALCLALFIAGLFYMAEAGKLPAAPETPASLPLVSAGPGAFQPGAFPAGPPGRDGLPALGTWSATEAAATTGTWTSAPLATSAAFLQIRIVGALHPPATSLVLRTADGREVGPLQNDFSSPDRWKRINFPAPDGPFQIVARDNSASDWFAFTAPVEVSRLAWLAGKVLRPPAGWIGVGILVALGVAAIFRVRAVLSATASSPAWRLLPWLALGAYAVFFFGHLDPVAGPNDSGGYLNSAKALVSGHLGPAPRPVRGVVTAETDITPYLATTFHPHPSGRGAPEYPVGLPLVFAAAGSVIGLERAVPLVIVLQLVLGIIFTRLLARAVGLTGGWDWLAAGIIGLSPVYLHQGLQPQSDSPALVWCTAAVWLAWASRERWWLAAPAGLATGLAVLIRPSDALIALPLLVVLAGAWRQLALWVLAGVPAAAWLVWYNHTLYGNSLMTGYGDDIANGFAAHFVPLTLRSYAMWLPLMFTPLVVLAAAGPWLRELPARLRLALAVWAGVFLTFYACYWCTWDNWYNMRFVLPAAPAMVVLALFATRALAERAGLELFRARGMATTILLVLVLATQLIADSYSRKVLYWMRNNSLNAAGPRWLAAHVPPNAVVFARHATNSLLYYTDLTFVRSDHPLAQTPGFLADIARAGHPIYALNYWWEGHGAADGGPGRGQGRPALPGNWKQIAVLWDDEIHIWQWSPAPAPEQK